MADAAEALVQRGYPVRVLTSGRGYEDPSIKYAPRENRNGVDVVRLPFSSFGKKTILHRLVGQSLFLLQTILRGLFTRRLAGILVSTSPPMCSIAAVIIAAVRRVKITYWVMDVNPDQIVALGRASAGGIAVRIFNWLNRRILKRASDIVVLDRFMAERIERKCDVKERMTILPPWPHEDQLELIPKCDNPFIDKHGLRDKFVVMYSGNHSIASPLTTLLEAALRLRDETHVHFMFIGGGLGKAEVEDVIDRENPQNVTSLPYQPLSEIKYSLSAADLHVVALGNDMVGIIHPCKVYGAMSVARPILALGPTPSHVADLVDEYQIGWKVEHGDVDGTVDILLRAVQADPGELAKMGQTARETIERQLSKSLLCEKFCDTVLSGLPNRETPAPVSHGPPVEDSPSVEHSGSS